MKILLTTLFVFVTLTSALTQDKDMEIKFFNDRAKIKEKGIKEMTERVFQEWKKSCLRDSAKLRIKYSFDLGGNLVRVDEFRDQKLDRTIKYTRNESGRYYEKAYVRYDSAGNVKSTQKWDFEFDKKGRPIVERLKHDTVILLTNVLSYDKRGNYVKQVRDNYWEWHYNYNKRRKLTETKECRREQDSTVCFSFTKYKYQRDLLVAELKYDPQADTVWKTITYAYDNKNNLMEIFDPIRFTSRNNKGPEERIPEVTRFAYDERGNCSSKSLARENQEPFRCYFYDYKYY